MHKDQICRWRSWSLQPEYREVRTFEHSETVSTGGVTASHQNRMCVYVCWWWAWLLWVMAPVWQGLGKWSQSDRYVIMLTTIPPPIVQPETNLLKIHPRAVVTIRCQQHTEKKEGERVKESEGVKETRNECRNTKTSLELHMKKKSDLHSIQNCLLTLQQQPVLEEGLNCEVFAGTVHWQLWNHTLIVHFVLEPRSFDVKMTWSEQVFLCSESPWCPDVCGFYKYKECGMLLQCKYVQVENSYSSGAPPKFHRRIKVQDQTIEPVIVYSLRKAKAETCAARDEQRAGRTANVSPCLMCHNWKFHYRGKSHTHARNVIHMTRMNGGRYGQLRLRWVSIGPKPVLGQ